MSPPRFAALTTCDPARGTLDDGHGSCVGKAEMGFVLVKLDYGSTVSWPEI